MSGYQDILDSEKRKRPNPWLYLWLLLVSVLATLGGFGFRLMKWPFAYHLIAIGFTSFFIYSVVVFLLKAKRQWGDWLYLWAIMLLLPGVFMQLIHFQYANYFILAAIVLLVINFIWRIRNRPS